MSTGVEVDVVLAALSRRIGDMAVELEVAKLELEQAQTVIASLTNRVNSLNVQVARLNGDQVEGPVGVPVGVAEQSHE